MKKILIADKINSACSEYLRTNFFDVDIKTGLSREELKNIINQYHALIIRHETTVDEEILQHANNLEVIGKAGASVDQIDVDEATKRGIVVMNTPGGNTISAAELTFSMILALSRKIPAADKLMKSGIWNRKSLSGIELHGKVLGIVGLGNVGKEVAKKAAAFEMNVIAYDPNISKILAYELGIELVDFEELLGRSDIISIHAPINEKTRNLFNQQSFSKCKTGVRIINCAQGGIINEADLLVALNSGKVSGAALDVFEKEPSDNMELIQHPNVVCTPHLGASTEDAQEKVARQIASQISDFFAGNPSLGIVNAAAIQFLNNPEIKPYLSLAEKIGKLQSYFITSKPISLDIVIYGSKIHKYYEVISSAYFKGYFQKSFGDKINFVNSNFYAKENLITVNYDFKDRTQNYSNLISFQLNTSSKKSIISGSVFFNLNPRIVHIDEYEVEFIPSGKLIIYFNEDTSGILSNVTTILANNKINIAGLYLGRNQRGSNALTIMSTDEYVSDRIIEQIKNVKGILNLFALEII